MLRLLFNMVEWSVLTRLQWSIIKEDTAFKPLNKVMICIDMYVGQLQTKHVNVLWHADQWTHMYMSNKRLSIFLPFLKFILLMFCLFVALSLSYTCEVTGFLRAGTAALWRWSNPPGRTEGTQKCAFHRARASSTAASVHGASQGSLERRASCSPSPPAPALHGCSCLKGWRRQAGVFEQERDRIFYFKNTWNMKTKIPETENKSKTKC